MSLIVLCGHPCSGKSTIAAKLATELRQAGHDVVIVDEESMHLKRDSSYKDAVSEKNTRGLLRSTTDRNLTRARIVIFDSLNFISGYRYELWCIARGSGARYCMVHIDTPIDTCRQWNEDRCGDTYSAPIFEDLVGRFERPDARKRWDAPLFTVQPPLGEEHIAEQIKAIAVAATQVSAAATAAAVAAGASVSAPIGKKIAPTLATQRTALACKFVNNIALQDGIFETTNLLHDIDKATQSVVDRITEATSAAAGGPPGMVKFDDEMPSLNVHRVIPLPELRRHKRSFIKLATNNTFNRVRDPQLAQKMFIDYLRDQLQQP